MLRLLLVAPGCDGNDVGESRAAYQWARRFASCQEVTVLTYYKRGHAPASGQLSGARVVEWPEPALVGRAERFNSLIKPGYLPFYLRARHWLAAALARGERFDIAHQVTPAAMRYPSPLAGLGIPFVIGPVGGGLESPAAFRPQERRSAWYLQLRRADQFRMRRDPALRRTYEEAACVVGIAPYIGARLAGLAVRRFEVMSETAIESLVPPVDRTGRTGPVRLLFAGRLIRTKGVQDAIRALAMTRDLPVVLDIAGAGPEGAACRALAADLGVAERVRFHGWLPRAQLDELYRSADIFVFPSYREPNGNVVFEAMNYGLPMIVSAVGGPGYAVDASCGVRLPVISPDQYARDVATAVTRLALDPALRRDLGEGARRRLAELGLWPDRITRMEGIFASVLSGSAAEGQAPTERSSVARAGQPSP